MTLSDHERFRRELEKQLRADAALLYAAYCAKLRAYEELHQLGGNLGDLDPALLLPADLPLGLPPATVPAAPEAPSPAPRRRSPANELYHAIVAALPQLPARFDSGDVVAALSFAPRPASLYRVLGEMVAEGRLALDERGEGKRRNRYRQLHAAATQRTD